jgi:hypothetical protein
MERRALATYVAAIDSRQETRQAEHAALGSDRGFGALLASGLTLFALAADGYHPYAEDGGLYAAGVKWLLNPALYPHGREFVLEPMRLSLFAPVVAGIVRLSGLGLPVVLLVLHLASVWATLFAAWMLAGRCWSGRSARAGAVVLLACWLTLPVAGTALLLMDPYVTARSFSTPCMVLALVGMLDFTERSGANAEAARRWRGLLICAGSMVVAAAMHPLMAAYALGTTLMLGCVRSSRRSVRLWGTAAAVAAALALAGCLQTMAKPESEEYARVAATRTYWFLANWHWYELAGLAAPLAILAAQAWWQLTAQKRDPSAGSAQVAGRPAGEARRALARMAVAAGATAVLIAALFAREGAAIRLVARMQPLRAFQIVYLVMVLGLGAKLGERVLRRSAWRWGAAMLLLGGAMLAAERGAFPNSNHLELPRVAARNLWVQAFVWIRGNTPQDALFALDADYINAAGEDAQCFRAIAERSALPDYSKDGGEAAIAPELAGAWATGQAAQQGLGRSSRNAAEADAARIAALRPLGVSWVVMAADAATNFDGPYRNAAVRVCRLR